MNKSTAGPPQGATAPSGGSEPHAVGSVGALKPRIVFFDLDHTLIPFDSDYAWGQFTTQLGWTDGPEFDRENDRFYADYKAGTLDIHAYVRFSTEAIRRQGATKSIAAHADFMGAVVQKDIKSQALELVRQHQQAGDTVVVVTATNEFVTRPIAKALGVDELIAIELETDSPSAWYTGEIRGTPSFREGKVTRVRQWLHNRGLDWAGIHSTFYTDSINDLPLMERVNVPVATNPDATLRQIALERGWRILDLFQSQ
ncbi:MAG: HAD family hydrolase [Rhodoferax sp.]|nr:HAD family hydrolase [Rhodoferax sp.]